ncbi:MAG: trypsin-like peptidase domain-containing protein [Vicinamibacterales bacterium]
MKKLILAVVLVSCGAMAALVVSGRMRVNEDAAAGQNDAAVPPATEPAAAQPRLTGGPDFSQIAERTINGVTNISSIQPASQRVPIDDPVLRYFFGDDDVFGRQRRLQSLGSGVIVSVDGYVLTNTHVVGSPNAVVTVALGDKRELPATVVGVDPMTDIAVLRIEGSNLPAIPWGDSSKLKIAEWVLAIGNPYQLSQTVTLGIVSAIGRSLEGRVAGYEDFIQTDAAINPGNSGGALINSRGELVGINTAIFSQSGGYQGIGFAVPSNVARRIMAELRQHGEVRRGWVGITEVASLTSALARELGVESTRGAIVINMVRGSAFDAGLRPEDVIVSFNGQPVNDASHLLRLLADAPIGSTVTLGVIQEGERREIKVRIAQREVPRRRRAL